MANKNKKRFDPGRSILHVNKSIGGFCKSAKKGRLGKNCIHFGGSGRCNFTGRWCNNSSTCVLYERKKK